jgi:TolB protein
MTDRVPPLRSTAFAALTLLVAASCQGSPAHGSGPSFDQAAAAATGNGPAREAAAGETAGGATAAPMVARQQPRHTPAATQAPDAPARTFAPLQRDEDGRVLPPIPGAEPADDLIQEGEHHFAQLFRLTRGGENAEAYWNSTSDRLVLQRRNEREGVLCDRIYVTDPRTGVLEQVSSGRGVTTCGYFLSNDREVIFASTQAYQDECPPPPDMTRGYVWNLHPEHDLWVRNLETGAERRLTESFGYDAEATVSPKGDRIVFTSTRSGDLELWTCDPDGGNLFQVTDSPGYDGGAFFSHDGTKLVFRATAFTPGREEQEIADYRANLASWFVRPSNMEIYVIDAEGTNRRRVTDLGGANFAPYFTPDDQSILFSTNHHVGPRSRNFDLFLIDVDGSNLRQVTNYPQFDSFPMFSPCGRWLAFSSNRGGTTPGETNVFIALWQDPERP